MLSRCQASGLDECACPQPLASHVAWGWENRRRVPASSLEPDAIAALRQTDLDSSGRLC